MIVIVSGKEDEEKDLGVIVLVRHLFPEWNYFKMYNFILFLSLKPFKTLRLKQIPLEEQLISFGLILLRQLEKTLCDWKVKFKSYSSRTRWISVPTANGTSHGLTKCTGSAGSCSRHGPCGLVDMLWEVLVVLAVSLIGALGSTFIGRLSGSYFMW